MEAHTAKQGSHQDGSQSSEAFRVVDYCNGIHRLCDALEMAHAERAKNKRYMIVIIKLQVVGQFSMRTAVMAIAFEMWREVAKALREVPDSEQKSPRRRRINKLYESFNQALFQPFPTNWDEALDWCAAAEKMFSKFYDTKFGEWRVRP